MQARRWMMVLLLAWVLLQLLADLPVAFSQLPAVMLNPHPLPIRSQLGDGPCSDSAFSCCITYPCQIPASEANRTIVIAAFTTMFRANLAYLRPALMLAIDDINNGVFGNLLRIPIDPTSTSSPTVTYKLAVIWADDKLSQTEIIYTFLRYAKNSSARVGVDYNDPDARHALPSFVQPPPLVPLFLGPVFSSLSIPASLTAARFNVPLISSLATSPLLSDKSLYPTFFRVCSGDDLQGPAVASIVKFMGWTQVCTLTIGDSYGSSLVQSFTAAAPSMGFRVLVQIVVPTSSSADYANAQIQIMKQNDCRIIFFPANSLDAVFMAPYLANNGLTGASYFYLGTDGWTADDLTAYTYQQLGNYLGTLSFYDPTTAPYLAMAQRWTNRYKADPVSMLNYTDIPSNVPLYYDAITYAVNALDNVLRNSRQFPTYNQTALLRALRTQVIKNGLTGDISVNSKQDRPGFYSIMNVLYDGTHVVVGSVKNGVVSLTALYDDSDPVQQAAAQSNPSLKWIQYPSGTSKPIDRSTMRREMRAVDSSARVVLWVLCGIGLALCLLACLYLLIHRRDKVIRMSSPRINVIIIIGVMMEFVAVILLGIDSNIISFASIPAAATNPPPPVPSSSVNSICRARIWLMVLGFSLAYGSCLAKIERIRKIFNSKLSNSRAMRDRQLIFVVGVFVTIDMIIMIVWQSTDSLQMTINDISGAAYTSVTRGEIVVPFVERCMSNNYMTICLAIIFFYKGTILVYGTHIGQHQSSLAVID